MGVPPCVVLTSESRTGGCRELIKLKENKEMGEPPQLALKKTNGKSERNLDDLNNFQRSVMK